MITIEDDKYRYLRIPEDSSLDFEIMLRSYGLQKLTEEREQMENRFGNIRDNHDRVKCR